MRDLGQIIVDVHQFLMSIFGEYIVPHVSSCDPALNEMMQEGVFHGIDSAYDLEERLPGLWSYAVGHVGGGEDGLPDGWLRYVIPTEDTNRSRWPVHPDWQVVQSAFAPVVLPESDYEREEREQEALLQLVDAELEARPWKDASKMVTCHTSCASGSALVVAPLPAVTIDLAPFMRRRRYQVNLRRMVAQIAGCSITAEAWRPAARLDGAGVDLSDTFHFLYEEVESYLEEKKRNFNEQVQKKRVLYSVEKEQAIA